MTDWNLLRGVMNGAIDACERIEKLDLPEGQLGNSTVVNNRTVSVWDHLQSAWTWPENSSYMVVRGRHQLAEDKAYTCELTRILLNAARFCSEYIGASSIDTKIGNIDPHNPKQEQTLRELAVDLQDWYRNKLMLGIAAANQGNEILS